ncbi:MAG: type II toxin-antitoxin system RelE/ParE family toxin [Devosia sp.]
MSYELIFLPRALKAWKKLDTVTRGQFRKKLGERLQNPRVPKDALHFKPSHYKIKLRDKGYRLIYIVDDQRVTVIVIDVGRRDEIYDEI